MTYCFQPAWHTFQNIKVENEGKEILKNPQKCPIKMFASLKRCSQDRDYYLSVTIIPSSKDSHTKYSREPR